MFQPDQFATRSQDLEEAFHDAGQFYWRPRKHGALSSISLKVRVQLSFPAGVSRILIQRKIGSVLNSCISCLSGRIDRHSATFSWSYFRCDASQSIGTGHVARCKVLARSLKRRGCRPVFLCRDLQTRCIARFFMVSLNL